jgi:endo-1,3-1,4-beta-glycanase ExoK
LRFDALARCSIMRAILPVALLAAVTMACAPSQPPAQLPVPAFVETFAAIDEERWVVADGWSNGDWTANHWREEQVQIAPHGIDIVLDAATDGDKPYASGELQSHEEFRYGYFETRMRVPRGSGLVTGFFTYTRDGHERTWEEIDVEILGRDTHSIQVTYFHRGRDYIVTRPLGFDAAADFHNYGFEWTPAHLRWYVDGTLVHEERGANVPLPRAAQRLYLHLWNTETLTDWLGSIDPDEGPWRLSVACVAFAPRYEGRPLCATSS